MQIDSPRQKNLEFIYNTFQLLVQNFAQNKKTFMTKEILLSI